MGAAQSIASINPMKILWEWLRMVDAGRHRLLWGLFLVIALGQYGAAAESGWLGVQVKPIEIKNMRAVNMVYGRGNVVVVADVAKGSPGEQLGIKPDDVILSVNYKNIGSVDEFNAAVAALSPGDRIALSVVHPKEKAQTLTGVLGKYPEGTAPAAAAPPPVAAALVRGRGMPVANPPAAISSAPSAPIPPAAPAAIPPAKPSARIFAPTGQQSLSAIALSPDGRYILSAGHGQSTIQLWDAATGRELETLAGHAENGFGNHALAFSPDGRMAISGGYDKTVRLWEIPSGKLISTCLGHTGMIFAVAFSPDGRTAASGSKDNTVKLWNVGSGQEIRTLAGHTDAVGSLAFSPDGRYLLTGGFDKTVRLWDTGTGEALKTFTGHQWQIASVGFSPDGKYGFSRSGDRIVKLWDIAKGRESRTFSADDVDAQGVPLGSQMVVSGEFSPDGRYMLTTGREGAIRLWDLPAGKVIKVFWGHTGWVPALAFSKDCRSILSAGADGSIRLWSLNQRNETAQFISLAQGEWVVLTGEGYYNSSLNAHKFLNILLNGKIYGIDQFYDVFYRPDIVAAKLRGDDITGLISLTLDEAIRTPPPTVEFASMPGETPDAKVKICYRVKSTGGGIGEVRLFHNGKLIESDGYYKEAARGAGTMQLASLSSAGIYENMRNIKVVGNQAAGPINSTAKGEQFEGCEEVDAIPGENEISISAFNSSNTVQSFMQTANFNSTVRPEDAHLYILAIGIDQYRDPSIGLKYAAKDAGDIKAKLLTQSATLFKPQNIHCELITDRGATKSSILNAITGIAERIRPADSFILFVAGHGILLQNQYYIITNDFDGAVNSASMISSNEIVEVSKKIKSLNQLFIFDTCHAGGVDTIINGLYDARISVLAKKMGLHIYASANGRQAAMDGYKGNGLFTHTLLDGLNNNREADLNKDGKVTIAGLGEYSKTQTTNLSRQIGYSQTPLIINFGKDAPLYLLK